MLERWSLRLERHHALTDDEMAELRNLLDVSGTIILGAVGASRADVAATQTAPPTSATVH